MAELKGEKEFVRSYQRAMRNVGQVVDVDAARPLAATAKQFAPARTGALRSSIVATRKARGIAAVQVGVRYAGFVEFGTRHMRGRRFVQRAMEARQGDIVAEIGKDVQQELDTIRGT